MKKISFLRKERKWRKYHKFETEYKKRVARNMSRGEGIRVFKELHEFGDKLKARRVFGKLDKDKIKTLSDIHAVFNKVKP